MTNLLGTFKLFCQVTMILAFSVVQSQNSAVCHVCGQSSKIVGKPDAMVNMPPGFVAVSQVSCIEIERIGLRGELPSNACKLAQTSPSFQTPCQCKNKPTGHSAPTGLASKPPPPKPLAPKPSPPKPLAQKPVENKPLLHKPLFHKPSGLKLPGRKPLLRKPSPPARSPSAPKSPALVSEFWSCFKSKGFKCLHR